MAVKRTGIAKMNIKVMIRRDFSFMGIILSQIRVKYPLSIFTTARSREKIRKMGSALNPDNLIYMDHAATTPCLKEAVDEMTPFLTDNYGNPAAIYGIARSAALAVREARAHVAASIGADASEIVFTSGGSEADTQALFSALPGDAGDMRGGHIIISPIEHHAVLNSVVALKKRGAEVTLLPVDEDGVVDPDEVIKAIRPDTRLISVMLANNEIGTIEPVSEIGHIARERGILFHTDAVQAFGHIPIDVRAMNIDILSASGHKMGAPKGIGFNYIRNGVRIDPLIYGGSQERGLRPGTLNVPGIVALGAASRISSDHLKEHMSYVKNLRDMFIDRILSTIPDVKLNGHKTVRLPGNVSISFADVESETLLILLDRENICASGGSACSTGALEPSHVLKAIGLDDKLSSGTIRFSLSYTNTESEIDTVVRVLSEKVKYLRKHRI